jgi:hypothetical protein
VTRRGNTIVSKTSQRTPTIRVNPIIPTAMNIIPGKPLKEKKKDRVNE